MTTEKIWDKLTPEMRAAFARQPKYRRLEPHEKKFGQFLQTEFSKSCEPTEQTTNKPVEELFPFQTNIYLLSTIAGTNFNKGYTTVNGKGLWQPKLEAEAVCNSSELIATLKMLDNPKVLPRICKVLESYSVGFDIEETFVGFEDESGVLPAIKKVMENNKFSTPGLLSLGIDLFTLTPQITPDLTLRALVFPAREEYGLAAIDELISPSSQVKIGIMGQTEVGGIAKTIGIFNRRVEAVKDMTTAINELENVKPDLVLDELSEIFMKLKLK